MATTPDHNKAATPASALQVAEAPRTTNAGIPTNPAHNARPSRVVAICNGRGSSNNPTINLGATVQSSHRVLVLDSTRRPPRRSASASTHQAQQQSTTPQSARNIDIRNIVQRPGTRHLDLLQQHRPVRRRGPARRRGRRDRAGRACARSSTTPIILVGPALLGLLAGQHITAARRRRPARVPSSLRPRTASRQ